LRAASRPPWRDRPRRRSNATEWTASLTSADDVHPQYLDSVLIAGSVDLTDTLRVLAAKRPVFHSEADLQFALAWEVQRRDEAMEVYLETRPAEGVHLDLAFERRDLGRYTAIELKYLTRAWSGCDKNGQHYALRNHGAQDIRAYDVVKDVCRVEDFVGLRAGSDGAVVVITNDASYWRPVKLPDATGAASFRVGEGAVITGPREWGPKAGPGTRAGRDKVLMVRHHYVMSWADYSDLGDGTPAGKFRQLIVEVPGSSIASPDMAVQD